MLLAATGLLSFSATSQVSLYTFSQLSGTYTAISGGTVFGTSSSDDDTFVNPASPATSGNTGVGIPIGFNFTFNGTVFDRFGINNNGWIGFGQSTLTPNPVAITNTGSNYFAISAASAAPALQQHRVAAFSRDLQGNGTNSTLRVQTIGTAPNQVCVIQWANYKKFGTNGTGDDMSFQIRLYETTNRVEVVYGLFINNANAGTAEVGLRGTSNADFNNRSTGATNPWLMSAPGTVNTSSVNYNGSGLTPNTGQIYRWDVYNLCTGTPAANAVASTFTTICPNGSSYMSLASSYSTAGLSYQWYVSNATAFGPYTVVPSGTTAIYPATNVTVTSWYQAVVTCSNGGATTTVSPFNLMIAATTVSNVPYYEGFEGITQNNQLPNCSWAASNLININQTNVSANTNNRIPHSGSKSASFKSGTNVAGDYFYTNGIQLEPGITYSAATWYITDGNLGWSELSLSYGSAQSSSGLTTIASQTGAVTGQFYQLLSNTFTVSSSGIYYIAIGCKGNSTPTFLTFDDISITIPCALNSPTMNVSISPSNLCIGQPVNAVASGADSYSWSTGDQTSAITFTPYANINLSVIGTNTLSGCSVTITPPLTINSSPVVSVFSNSQKVCQGSSAVLYAFGANTYTWNNGVFGSTNTVTPTTPTTYTVLGSNAIGCVGQAVYSLGINPLPIVTASTSAPNEICPYETVTLTAGGAVSYQWKSNSTIIVSQEANVSPGVTTIYTLTGTDANGCSASTQVVVNVIGCLGVNENKGGLTGMKVYPNPTNGDFTVELNNGLNKQMQLTDLTGRIILNTSSVDEKIKVEIQNLSAGVYYLKVSSDNKFDVIKIVKN